MVDDRDAFLIEVREGLGRGQEGRVKIMYSFDDVYQYTAH